MKTQVAVEPEPWADGIKVWITRDLGGSGGRLLVRPDNAAGIVEQLEPGTEPTGGPSLRLDDLTAIELLDALARHYRRATDTTNLRTDYDHERARVDLLIKALISPRGQAAP